MLERRRPTWPSGSVSTSRVRAGDISVVGSSSTRLASLLVHCLLDFSSRGWSVLGTNERDALDLRKRNCIIIVSSEDEDARTFRSVELGVATFLEARWVMVVNGWISLMDDSVWWMWK